jgi:hypothetical protein
MICRCDDGDQRLMTAVSRVLEQANAIQGPNLAFEEDGEGGVRPAFPAIVIDEVHHFDSVEDLISAIDSTTFVDAEGNEYTGRP